MKDTPITIAIASGKGGTGKTFVATNLAALLAGRGEQVAYLDCDVEEPNGHVFLQPVIEQVKTVGVPVPEVELAKCTFCGKCGEICQYRAIVVIKDSVLVFPELCNGCGGCARVCPEEAISEVPHELGVVDSGSAETIGFVQGRLKVGEARAVPLIREVRGSAPDGGVVFVDAPPGTSCPVIESVKRADFVLLVTEPTPFGLSDLRMTVGMVRTLNLPLAVVVNRADVGDDCVKRYCEDEGIGVLAEIPDDRAVAEAYSCGELAVRALPEYERVFAELNERILEQVRP